jgi:hypothetical protein
MMGKQRLLKPRDGDRLEQVRQWMAYKQRWEVKICLDLTALLSHWRGPHLVEHICERLGVKHVRKQSSHADKRYLITWQTFTKKEATQVADIVTQILFELNPSVPHWYEIKPSKKVLLSLLPVLTKHTGRIGHDPAHGDHL